MSAHKANPILYSSQEIDNESFNDTYKIIENALYIYQASTNSFVPAQADASGNLLTASSTGALSTNLTQVGGGAIALGQTTRANSIPVTLPSDGAGVAFGTWGYNAGISGTLTLTGGKRVLMISAIAEQAAATITINSGDTITLPYGATDKVSSALEIKPTGNLTNPTIIFSGTVAYFVEYVS